MSDTEKDFWFAWEYHQQEQITHFARSIVHEEDGEQTTDLSAYIQLMLALRGM